MANTSRTGFWPVGTVSGAPWQGSVRRYGVDGATNICIGDPVELQANGTLKLLTTGGTAFMGVVVGTEPVTKSTTSVQGGSTTLEVKYIPKGTAGKVLVCTAADTIYECTANFGANTTTIGTHANAIVADNTAVSVAKISSATLDSKNLVTTAGGTFRVIDIVDRVDNAEDAGTDGSNTKVLVVLNAGLAKAGVVGV